MEHIYLPAPEVCDDCWKFLQEAEELDARVTANERKLAKNPIVNITRNGLTFTATRIDGSKFTFTQKDDDTKYPNAVVGITRSGNTFTATRADGTTFTFTQTDTQYTMALSGSKLQLKTGSTVVSEVTLPGGSGRAYQLKTYRVERYVSYSLAGGEETDLFFTTKPAFVGVETKGQNVGMLQFNTDNSNILPMRWDTDSCHVKNMSSSTITGQAEVYYMRAELVEV